MGFSLNEIREVLDLRLDDDSSCDDIRERAQLKLSEAEKKIHELSRIKDVLKELIKQCDDECFIGDCPIVEALETDKFPQKC